MLLEKELINAVINVVTLLAVSCSASCFWTYLVFPFKSGGCIKYYRYITIKLLLVNVIGGVVMPFYVPEVLYSGMFTLLCILSGNITMAYLIYLGKGDLAFRFIAFMLPELYGGVCLGMAAVISSYLLRQPLYITAEIARKPTGYNVCFLIIGFVSCVVTTRLCRPFLKRFRKGRIKYQSFWVLVAVIYALLGQYSMINTNFWDRSFMHIAYVLAGSFLCLVTVSYLIYQKVNQAQLIRLNQILIMQQELLSGHYDDMEEQLRLTKEIRNEILFQVEELQQRLGECGPIYEIQNYVNSLKEQQKQWYMSSYSGNSMIEYILHHKIEGCRKRQIKAQAEIEPLRCDKTTEWNLLNIIYLLFEHMAEYCGGERWMDVFIWQNQDEICLESGFSVLETYRKRFIKQNVMLKKMLTKCRGELLLVQQPGSFEITVIISLSEMGAL